MASRAAVLWDGTIGRQEPLGLARRFNPLPPPLALTGRLVGILRAIVHIPLSSMFHTGQHRPLGSAIALESSGDKPPWHGLTPLEELAEEFLCGLLVPLALH
jgi:hypothetical protein